MRIEIDQSGKLEQLDTGTAIAYANSNKDAIWLSAATKRKIIQYLRTTLIPRRDAIAILFSIIIYLLINSLPKNRTIYIDEEYSGKDSIIHEALEKLLQKKYNNHWHGDIRFILVGKNSPAHKLAWQVHRSNNKLHFRTLSAKEIIKFLIQ